MKLTSLDLVLLAHRFPQTTESAEACHILQLSLFVAEQPSGFNLDFEVSGIYGYVILDGVLPSLHAITCAFWMKSSDVINYGTPISYALEGDNDNTFLLTDYNG